MFCLKTQFVPRCTHFILVTKAKHLRVYREIIALYSEIHTERRITLWAERGIF
jgi:hypothetical protein